MNRSGKVVETAIIALLVFCFNSCTTSTEENRQQRTPLKLITYNVWYGFTKVPDRKQAWIAWMKEQQPDIVALQELNEYTGQKLSQDAASYGHEHSALLKEEGFPTGITSRYPIEDTQRITEGFHHGLMRVRIKQIYFYIIHLHPSNWQVRKTEIRKILEDIETLPAGSAVILIGDFNTFSPLDSAFYAHQRLESFFDDRDAQYGEKNLNQGALDYTVIQEVMGYGFVDLEASLRSASYIFTGSFPTMIEKEGEHGDQRRLDYVFATKNLASKVNKAEIVASDTTLILSDHLPVLVEMDLVAE